MARESTRKPNALTLAIDSWQRRHPKAGFIPAIIRKYLDDEAGYRAALLAYYGFLSIFPLLLVLTTVFRIVLHNDPALSERIIHSAVNYFPAVGHDLQESVHSLGSTGLALLVGILLTLLGARGVADVLRNSFDHIWQVPFGRRSRFPASLLRSFTIIIVGGLSLAITPVFFGYALAFAPNRLFSLLSTVFTAFVLFWILIFIMKVGTSTRQPFKRIWVGALVAVVSLGILQSIGSIIVARELQRLDSLYGTFALVLGLIFWLYLQAQVLMFCLEIDSVRHFKLWPRTLAPPDTPLTEADRAAYRLYSDRARYHDADLS